MTGVQTCALPISINFPSDMLWAGSGSTYTSFPARQAFMVPMARQCSGKNMKMPAIALSLKILSISWLCTGLYPSEPFIVSPASRHFSLSKSNKVLIVTFSSFWMAPVTILIPFPEQPITASSSLLFLVEQAEDRNARGVDIAASPDIPRDVLPIKLLRFISIGFFH